MTKFEAFISKYGRHAAEAVQGTGVFKETVLTAAAFESGYAKSVLAARYNNFFGIKAGKEWKGKSVLLSTKEQRPDGSVYVVKAAFRVYDSPADSFKNYVKFISGPRYVKAGVLAAPDPKEQFKRLQAAGYATDISYSNKLTTLYNGVKNWAVEAVSNVNLTAVTVTLLVVAGVFF